MTKQKKLSATEEHAQRLVTASKIYQNLQHQKARGIHNVPPRHRAGAPDPYDRSGNSKLAADYRYYRIAAPDTNEGRRVIEFIKHLGYEVATDGEYFPHLPGGQIYKCHPSQYDEATRAMKMVASREHTKAAQNERARLQETARHRFGSGDVTAEIETRQVDPRNL